MWMEALVAASFHPMETEDPKAAPTHHGVSEPLYRPVLLFPLVLIIIFEFCSTPNLKSLLFTKSFSALSLSSQWPALLTGLRGPITYA